MIIEPFNGVFFGMVAIFVGLLVAASLLLRKASRKTRRYVLAFTCVFTFVIFWLYKVALCVDEEYSAVRVAAGLPAFSWWTELPFHLCNINLMLIPVAAFTDNRRLYSFCFFVAPLGALMALIVPSTGFAGYSIWLPRNLGFYFTHIIIFISGIAIASFGLYRPSMRDVPWAFFMVLGIAACVVGLDFLLCAVADPGVNYFYAMYHDGISVLEFFWNLVPVKGLYLLPCGLSIFLPYVALVSGGFEIGYRIRDKRKAKKQAKA